MINFILRYLTLIIFSYFYIDPEGPRGHPGGSGADFGGGKQEFFSCRHVKHMGCEVRKHRNLKRAVYKLTIKSLQRFQVSSSRHSYAVTAACINSESMSGDNNALCSKGIASTGRTPTFFGWLEIWLF